MCTTKVSPTAVTGSPVAAISIPELSIATWPCGSHSTAKIVGGLGADQPLHFDALVHHRTLSRRVSYRHIDITPFRARIELQPSVEGAHVSDTMRAFVIKEIGRTEVMEKPIPEPGPEEAVVRTTAALICTSDVHTVKGALPVPADRTLGHESVGVIHTARARRSPGSPRASGWPSTRSRRATGAATASAASPASAAAMLGGYKYTVQMDGNMAEYFVVPGRRRPTSTPIPDDLSDEQAVYACDMLSTGFMGAEHAYLQFGETVAVFAQGPVGLCATMGANLLGAGPDHRGRVAPGAAGAGQAVRRRRHRRLHARATPSSRSWTSPAA